MRCVACVLGSLLVVSACGGGGGTSGDDGGAEGGGGLSEGGEDGEIRGTFVFLDGTETDFERGATYAVYDNSERMQFSCEAQDPETRLTLGLTWFGGTTVGTHEISLLDGPFLIAGWPSADGTGYRATAPGSGEVTFDSVGDEPGDVISGSATAVLMPEADDPDDLVEQIVEIEFSCEVPEG